MCWGGGVKYVGFGFGGGVAGMFEIPFFIDSKVIVIVVDFSNNIDSNQ